MALHPVPRCRRPPPGQSAPRAFCVPARGVLFLLAVSAASSSSCAVHAGSGDTSRSVGERGVQHAGRAPALNRPWLQGQAQRAEGGDTPRRAGPQAFDTCRRLSSAFLAAASARLRSSSSLRLSCGGSNREGEHVVLRCFALLRRRSRRGRVALLPCRLAARPELLDAGRGVHATEGAPAGCYPRRPRPRTCPPCPWPPSPWRSARRRSMEGERVSARCSPACAFASAALNNAPTSSPPHAPPWPPSSRSAHGFSPSA